MSPVIWLVIFVALLGIEVATMALTTIGLQQVRWLPLL